MPANGFLHHPKERCKNSGKKSFTWHQQHLGTVVLAQHSSLHALVVLILFYMLACFFLFDGESGERERLSLLLSAVKSRDETRDETQQVADTQFFSLHAATLESYYTVP